MENKPVDLNVLIEEFNSWDKYVAQLIQENKLLEHKLEMAYKTSESTKEREEYLLEELKSMREMVESMQAALSKCSNLEDENNKLKLELENTHEKMDSLLKENQEKLSQMNCEIEQLKEIHRKELDEMKTAILRTASVEKAELMKSLNEKDNQISNLEKQLVDAEKEKQSELIKLRLEYDSKILDLQKKMARPQHTGTQISNCNQEIFRKKLEHQKAKSEHEIASLKRIITELQNKIDAQKRDTSLANQSGALSLTKRKRY